MHIKYQKKKLKIQVARKYLISAYFSLDIYREE